MSNLISKNPVLRFKLGKKIVKAEEGLKTRIIRKGLNTIRNMVNTITNPDFWFNTTGAYNWQYGNNNPLIYTLSKIDLAINPTTSKSSVNSNPQQDTSYIPPTSPQQPKYYWKKGYRNRVLGLGLKSRDDVKALLNKLGVKDDGIWGEDTEAAYRKKFGFLAPTTDNTNPEELNLKAQPLLSIDIKPIQPLSFTYPTTTSPTYNPIMGFDWKNVMNLSYFKQGGLVSKNPIERFRTNFRTVAQ